MIFGWIRNILRQKSIKIKSLLWLPGTDHASIATEVKVLNKIKEDEGKTKDDLTREEFLDKAWQWRDIYGRKIVNQMKKLGNSCDWSKERFTMDEGCNDAVTEVFVNLYNKNLIYKGNRIINWCPDCQTTLSDAEVEHAEKAGHFFHIKYQIKGTDDYLEIATTRPETMLGDTAIAVNPDDKRYHDLIGKTAILPIVNREIPIIGDKYVDLETGTGALKVTPSHDPNDFLIGKRHNLEEISVIDEKGFMNEKDMKLIPERFGKTYNHWLEGIRDWCISRQLWWGHRIPAYYCEDCGETMVSKDAPHKCSKCGSESIKQDPDVLDTWFSSALWPFSTMGWPEKTEELDYFYPTNVLVTGYDIIFFWVIRMMFSGIEQMGETPFEYTLIHGLVRDSQGRKMSKSLGNGVDPLEIISEYGADALRFMLMTGNSPGNDMKFMIEKVEASRNFANKIWNASRFVMMGLEDSASNFELTGNEELDLSDKWILSRLNEVTNDVTSNLEKFELGLAANKIYEFVWDEYCDWYIELAKKRLYGDDEEAKLTVQKVLMTVLKDVLKFMHPFMPFITEEIWTHMNTTNKALIISDWPEFDETKLDENSVEQMNGIMDAIKNIRNVRATMDVSPKRKAKLLVVAEGKVKENIITNKQYLVDLASCSEVVLEEKANISNDAVSVVIEGAELFMPLSDLINFEVELKRLEDEKKSFESEIKRAQGKLSNKGFVNKAPEALINKEKDKIKKFEDMLVSVNERIESIKTKL